MTRRFSASNSGFSDCQGREANAFGRDFKEGVTWEYFWNLNSFMWLGRIELKASVWGWIV